MWSRTIKNNHCRNYFCIANYFRLFVFFEKNKIKNTDSLNLAIIINQNISDSNIKKIIEDIKKISNELNFVSMSRTNKNTNINLDIYPKKFENLIKITDSIKNHYKNSKIIIARGNDLSLWI